MDALEAMRTTGTNRFYLDKDVPDEVIHKAADSARFAPQGGNRQPVRLVVIRDRVKKERLAELYLPWWKAYFEAGVSKLGGYANASRASLDANDPPGRLRAGGQAAARNPRGLPDRLPRRRRLPGNRLPEEADPGPGRGDGVRRHLR
jgi:nitroreductase